MPLPKKKIPRSHKLTRRASCFMPIKKPTLVRCPNCNALKRSHFVCQQCGWYKGSEVVSIKTKEKTSD